MDEMERFWKEAIMAESKVLSQHLPEGTKEIHEKLCHNSQHYT
jgi:hypothetical protein